MTMPIPEAPTDAGVNAFGALTLAGGYRNVNLDWNYLPNLVLALQEDPHITRFTVDYGDPHPFNPHRFGIFAVIIEFFDGSKLYRDPMNGQFAFSTWCYDCEQYRSPYCAIH